MSEHGGTNFVGLGAVANGCPNLKAIRQEPQRDVLSDVAA
jgi:hypothetical protein